jgi:predicted RNA binding protein YcfA (HicA-like mRNA interferase family)
MFGYANSPASGGRDWYGVVMTRPDKLYQQLLASTSRSISFRDFERLLRAFGFVLDRTVGSHRQYVHPDIPVHFLSSPPERTRNGTRCGSSLNLLSAMAYI